MKNYREVKYITGEEPVTLRESVSMAEHHAADANAQFPNTGIKYELLEEQTEFVATESSEALGAHSLAGTPVAPLLNDQLHAAIPGQLGAESVLVSEETTHVVTDDDLAANPDLSGIVKEGEEILIPSFVEGGIVDGPAMEENKMSSEFVADVNAAVANGELVLDETKADTETTEQSVTVENGSPE